MNSIANLSAQQLRRAAEVKDKIAKLDAELERLLGSLAKSVSVAAPKKRGRRKMSAAARKKIAAAAKARWAKVKAAGKKRL